MFQQLANALNLEVSAVEDFLFGDERVGVKGIPPPCPSNSPPPLSPCDFLKTHFIGPVSFYLLFICSQTITLLIALFFCT